MGGGLAGQGQGQFMQTGCWLLTPGCVTSFGLQQHTVAAVHEEAVVISASRQHRQTHRQTDTHTASLVLLSRVHKQKKDARSAQARTISSLRRSKECTVRRGIQSLPRNTLVQNSWAASAT